MWNQLFPIKGINKNIYDFFFLHNYLKNHNDDQNWEHKYHVLQWEAPDGLIILQVTHFLSVNILGLSSSLLIFLFSIFLSFSALSSFIILLLKSCT